jgi:hypothetical protein
VKTDRFSLAFLRKIGVFAASFLLAADLSTAGGTLTVGPITIGINSPAKKLAKALAPQVQEVQTRLAESRRTLPIVQSSDGKPAFLRKDVADLIARTGSDLDQAIEKVQPSALAPLRAWSDDALAKIQAELGALPRPKNAALPSGPSSPRTFAVFASLSSAPKRAKPKPTPTPEPPKPVAPPPDTVPAEKSNSLLDELGEVVSQIFTLASNDDLEVKLWAGSTAPHATFSFWPQGQVKGATPATLTIRTNDKRDHVIRGLYAYQVAWTIVDSHAGRRGSVMEFVEYPNPDGGPADRSERLDLVKGSRFFCCRFDQHYCHHVANEKECHP